jgi:hypothetical protein
MPNDLSPTMERALSYALTHGDLYRFPGGFWARQDWRQGERPWFGTSTVDALVTRGRMEYSEWHEGGRSRFPICARVCECEAGEEG